MAAIAAQSFSAEAPPKEKKEPREFLPPPFERYIQRRVAELSGADWQRDITAENWPAKKTAMRAKLQRMLGLDPWPERGDLKTVVTGTVAGDGFVVEKLYFQSLPGLYIAANLFRPKDVPQPLPAILYVSGHSRMIENGISLGNKTDYRHHGIWFARHGYVCIVLDTIQWGEILGQHWGTYNLGRWWWPARGYTPAGVEAWNGIRALDYLESRPEVDRARIGMTGRSGGGAYSWWVAALDERIKVAVPTAGITTLKNHVLDGAIEGHCDCMYMVNTERWDFDRVAALVAPRALCIANTDKDEIFPLDGVMEIYRNTRALYKRLGHEENIGLQIAEGPHKDTQPLNTGAFHWFNRFLKGADRMDLTDEPARKMLEPRELKVFAELPKDERTTTIDESFVPAAEVRATPASAGEWERQRNEWMQALREECFRAWPPPAAKMAAQSKEGIPAQGVRLTECEFVSEEPFTLKFWLLYREGLKAPELEHVDLKVLDEEGWGEFSALAASAFPAQFPGVQPDTKAFAAVRDALLNSKHALAFFCPRGIGPTGWTKLSSNKQTQLRRRLLLLGESLESGQVWDICQAAAALRSMPGCGKIPLALHAQKVMAGNALYSSLFIPGVQRLELHNLPASHRNGPIYLNVLRHLDIPQALALAAERCNVVLETTNPEPWRYAQAVASALHLGDDRLQIRKP